MNSAKNYTSHTTDELTQIVKEGNYRKCENGKKLLAALRSGS